jgi:hypothetical protein
MSFDPFHEQQPLRPPAPPPALESNAGADPAPGGTAPPSAAATRDRLLTPSILLIIVGVLNLLFAGYIVASTLYQLSLTPEQITEAAKVQRALFINFMPSLKEVFDARDKEGITPEDDAKKAMPYSIAVCVASVLGALLPLFAGIRMLQLRNYGLVLFGALVSAIPCVSGSGCCCIGEIAGVYAVIMLLQPDIRDAFR